MKKKIELTWDEIRERFRIAQKELDRVRKESKKRAEEIDKWI